MYLIEAQYCFLCYLFRLTNRINVGERKTIKPKIVYMWKILSTYSYNAVTDISGASM